jgi:ribonuclease-3
MDISEQAILDLGLPPTISKTSLSNAFVNRPVSRIDNNERLEFLGDSVIQLIITKYLYVRYNGCQEGGLTKRRTRLVCGQVMSDIGLKLGLQKYIKINNKFDGTEDNKPEIGLDLIEDTFEAIAATIFIECGYDAAEKWVVWAYESNLDVSEAISDEIEHKDRLLKYFSRVGRPPPDFVVTKTDKGTVTVVVKTSRDNIIGVGKGRTKKSAENDASLNAFKYLSC